MLARSAARRWASGSIKAFQISGRTANEGALPSASTTSVIEDFIDWPVSASHTACTCERMSSSLVRSRRGACTEPATIWSLRRNQYVSWLFPVEQYVTTSAGCPERPARPERWA